MPNPLDPTDGMHRMLLRKGETTAKGGPAFQRLLQLAETRDSGQVGSVPLLTALTALTALTGNGKAFPFDPFELRTVGEVVSDDRLSCTDVLRWRQTEQNSLAPDGDRRRVWEEKGGHRGVGPEAARGPVTNGCVRG